MHVFILADKMASDKVGEDASTFFQFFSIISNEILFAFLETMLEAISIHQYCPSIPLSVEVISSKHQHILNSFINAFSLCINDIKMVNILF